VTLSPAVLERTSTLLSELSRMWVEEIPLKIHSGGFDSGGAPKLSPEFLDWLEGKGRHGDRPAAQGVCP
jgi:hypothetical protein